MPHGFMPRAAEMVRAAGGLVIADEVQAGYCRTGRWWGYEVTGFTPDIVVTGKPMGNGLPLAALDAALDDAALAGVALAHGDEGRCARVRTSQGRVVCARPVADGLAELTL